MDWKLTITQKRCVGASWESRKGNAGSDLSRSPEMDFIDAHDKKDIKGPCEGNNVYISHGSLIWMILIHFFLHII